MIAFRLFNTARAAVPRVFPLMRHKGVPRWLKVTTICLALLIVSPLNILGDIPVLGIFDDVALLALLSNVFVRAANASLRYDLAGPVGTLRNVTPGIAQPRTREATVGK